MAERGPYKRDARDALATIELRRRRLGITLSQLAERAGMIERTLTNIRRTGLAFPRQLKSLQRALVLLEREQRDGAILFGGKS